MSPVGVKVPAEGSYSSALAHFVLGTISSATPPANKTLPFGSKVAVWDARGTVRFPVGVNVPEGCASAAACSIRSQQNLTHPILG